VPADCEADQQHTLAYLHRLWKAIEPLVFPLLAP